MIIREPEDIYQLLAGIIDPTCWIERSERISDDKDGEYIKLEWHCTNFWQLLHKQKNPHTSQIRLRCLRKMLQHRTNHRKQMKK